MNNDGKIELRRLFSASVIPAFFMALAWLMFAAEGLLNVSLSQYGLMPREISHWFGILTMPFLHGGLSHIFANTVSFIVLGTMLFYFYPEKALHVFLISYFFSGIITWLIASGGVHIGASGMIYAFAAYIFTVGVRSGNIRNMAVSLIIVFLYGSMVWGLYPQNTGISWEGHLAGAVTGLVCAFIFPIKTEKPESLDDDEVDDDYDYNSTLDDSDYEIKYHYNSGKNNGK